MFRDTLSVLREILDELRIIRKLLEIQQSPTTTLSLDEFERRVRQIVQGLL